MGGIWFPPEVYQTMVVQQYPYNSLNEPILWRAPLTLNIHHQAVSHDNPQSTITKCDPEIAGTISHGDVMAN